MAPRHVIGLGHVPGLTGIEANGRIDARRPRHASSPSSALPAFAGALRCLIEGAEVIGGHQVRNVGTVGGNLVNASPAADLAPCLYVARWRGDARRPGWRAHAARRALPPRPEPDGPAPRRAADARELPGAAPERGDGLPEGGAAAGDGDLRGLRGGPPHPGREPRALPGGARRARRRRPDGAARSMRRSAPWRARSSAPTCSGAPRRQRRRRARPIDDVRATRRRSGGTWSACWCGAPSIAVSSACALAA